MENRQDDLLISKLNEGNIHAFEQLYEKYSARLFNSVSLLLSSKELAKDITQNCFLIIWEKREMLDSRKNFQAYLYTVARNLVYKETERLLLHHKFIDIKTSETESFEDDIVDEIHQAELQEYIGRLVNELPDTPRKIFELKKNQNLSNKEIASQLDITERAVEAHFYRTLKLLKSKLSHFLMVFFAL